jgi:2-amino-4-hydroxy-6-hydroxymethyldihydropteridine diphosphokinase
MARCLLALGSNLGDRPEILRRATHAVASLPNSQLLGRSRWHETEPIGGPGGQGAFLNGCLLLDTQLTPAELLGALQEIEQQLGRQRNVLWDARAIDIDLLLYDLQQLETEALTLPHSRMSYRCFVLQPACEIAAAMIHPASGWTLSELLSHLTHAARYVAVTAAEPEASQRLTEELCRVLGSPKLESLSATPAVGSDSPPSKEVESDQEMAELLQESLLQESRWRKSPEFAARLPDQVQPALPPVLSSFWVEGTRPEQVRPALVIAWEKSAPVQAGSALKIILDRPGHGPMARIQGEDLSAVLAEALAAIRAAWPAIRVANMNPSLD